MEISGPVLIKFLWISFEFDFVLMPILFTVGCTNNLGWIKVIWGSIGYNSLCNSWLKLCNSESEESSLNQTLHFCILCRFDMQILNKY